jgi:3-dehydroquinate dehydratase-2
MHRIFILGGPNLGRLGTREPEIYGRTTWTELGALCRTWAEGLDLDIVFEQTDGEGDLVKLIHRAGDEGDGLILNAAAYTHTSVAVRDAVSAVTVPVVELHISNPASREDFRRTNLLSDVVTASICGFGIEGYRLALEGIASLAGKA